MNIKRTLAQIPTYFPDTLKFWILSFYISFTFGDFCFGKLWLIRPVWRKISICNINFNFKFQKSKKRRQETFEVKLNFDYVCQNRFHNLDQISHLSINSQFWPFFTILPGISWDPKTKMLKCQGERHHTSILIHQCTI